MKYTPPKPPRWWVVCCAAVVLPLCLAVVVTRISIGITIGWLFCLYCTMALLRPQLVAVYSVSPSDSLPDVLVSWGAVMLLWWLWVRCALNAETP